MEAYFDEKNHPKVKLVVGGRRKKHLLNAIIDTGFDGFLSLPLTIAVGLGLELTDIVQVQYADGRISNELVFAVNVEINNKTRAVQATLTNSIEALAGTALFANNKVLFDFSQKKISIS